MFKKKKKLQVDEIVSVLVLFISIIEEILLVNLIVWNNDIVFLLVTYKL